MSLIESPRFQPGDVEHWRSFERDDAIWSRTDAFLRQCRLALESIVDFAEKGPCYAGTSWGKDSTVLAHLVWCAAEEMGTTIPLVHVDCQPINNPDCRGVRERFLERWPTEYHEIVVHCIRNNDAPSHDYREGWHATGTIEQGFAVARRRFGARHISGVRGQESAGRRKRMRTYGISTDRTCAPIGYWSARDVWAYLYAHDLPVHPAYAMSMGGALDRDRLRVAFLGLRHGEGVGRREWEQTYYPVL